MSGRMVADIRTQASVYDGRTQEWTGVDHGAPDVVLLDVDLRGPSDRYVEFMQGLLADMEVGVGIERGMVLGDPEFSVHRDAWKTLVRYVWHNARSVPEACVYFGVAALHLDGGYGKRMLRAELRAIGRRGVINGHRLQRVFGFDAESVFRVWSPLSGYTPLSALLQGEHGEWRGDAAAQGRRGAALRAIVRAAWQDVDPGGKAHGKWEETLRAAFMNFTALTGEDRDLLAFITQTEFAEAFSETRAAMCARRKRRVKRPMRLNGFTATTAPGGKSEAAIQVYRKAQMGNHNRAGDPSCDEATEDRPGGALCNAELKEAVREMREHDGIPIRRDLPRDARALRKHLRALADEAERRRLAALCGVDADQICMEKTKAE